jgi:hypothetical protein
MKKIYLLLFVTAGTTLVANAQAFKQGDKLLGGSIGVSNTNPSGQNNDATAVNVSPSIGFFTKPNRLTGFSLTLNSNLNAQHSVGAAIYKQYWNDLGKNAYFIMQGDVALSYGTNKSGNQSNPGTGMRHSQNYSISAGISPGFAYRLNRRLVVDAFLADFLRVSDTYAETATTFSSGNKVKSTVNSINLYSGLSGLNLGSIRVGFRYIF